MLSPCFPDFRFSGFVALRHRATAGLTNFKSRLHFSGSLPPLQSIADADSAALISPCRSQRVGTALARTGGTTGDR